MVKLDQKVLFLLFGRVFQALLAILTVKLLTNFLPQNEIGYQYLINSIVLWFSLVLINPVGMFVNRHLHEWKKRDEIYFYISQLNKYFSVVAIVSIPVFYVMRYIFHIGESLPEKWTLVFIIFYIYFSTWFQTITSFFNLLDMQKIFVLLTIFAQMVGLIFAFSLNQFYSKTALVWMSGLLLGQILCLIVAFFIFLKTFPRQVSSDSHLLPRSLFHSSTLKFVFPVSIATLFMWFMSQGYRLIVERDFGPGMLANIGVGLGLAMSIAGVIESITTQYLYPRYYADLVDSDLSARSRAWLRLWNRASIVYIPFCFLTMSLSYIIVRVLTSASFHGVYKFVWFGAFIELFRQLSNITYLVSHGEKKTQSSIFPYFTGGAVLSALLYLITLNQAVNVYFILCALLLANIATFIVNLVTVKKMIEIKLEVRRVLKPVAASLPVVVFLFLLNVNTSLPMLFVCAGICGIWILAVIYYFLKSLMKELG